MKKCCNELDFITMRIRHNTANYGPTPQARNILLHPGDYPYLT